MPTASPSDVTKIIDTALSDTDISDVLSHVSRDIDREYADDIDVEFDDNQHRADFEAVLTALRIVTGRDREVTIERRGEVRVDYGASSVARLQARVTRLDPGDAFSQSSGVVRNDERYTGSVRRRD